MIRLPNWLATRNGRLGAFFLLYVTEGIPLGFAATALATQMRRAGVGAEAIGAFVAAIYLPWAFKWAMGPIVDVFASDRFGRRRAWIVSMQVAMVLSLLAMQYFDLSMNIAALTWLVILHNCFAATQDVAIDALAVTTLSAEERGVANGLMFGGAYLGQTLGGAGVLFLVPHVGFDATYWFVAAAILTVTVFVALPLQEPVLARVAAGGAGLARIGAEMRDFLVETWRTISGSRAARVAALFAILPAGAYSLGTAVSNTLAVDLGLDDQSVAAVNLWTTIAAALGCIAGGWLSDRFGRRRMLALFIASMAPAVLWLAWSLQRAGWVEPVTPGSMHPAAPAFLVTAFWVSSLAFSLGNGLMYAARGALFMDVTNPRVAATQFTAYMAMTNLVIAYSNRWQGWSVEQHGYATTMYIDVAVGFVSMLLLPLIVVAGGAAAIGRAPPPRPD